MNSEETMAIVVMALLWQGFLSWYCFCVGKRRLDNRAAHCEHSTVKGAILADGAFAGPIFLSSRSCSELTRAAFLRE